MCKKYIANGNLAYKNGNFNEARFHYLDGAIEYRDTILEKYCVSNLDKIHERIFGRFSKYKKTLCVGVLMKDDQSQQELNELLTKLTYYYSGSPSVKVKILTALQVTPQLNVANDYDPSIDEIYRSYYGFISTTMDPNEIVSCDFLLSRDANPKGMNKSIVQEFTKMRPRKKVYYVDKESTRQEGSFYIHSLYEAYGRFDQRIEELHKKFLSIVGAKKNNKAYLFASGPSVEGFGNYDYSDGVTIICNTLTLNKALMEHVQPDILVFADPIFHFGCSVYASDFRDSVKSALENYPNLIIVSTIKYLYMFETYYPEYLERIVCVPISASGPLNHELGDPNKFFTRATDNIFTLIMLPLACYLSKQVFVLGFDGRPKNMGNKFWNYAKGSQNNDAYNSLKRIHPGFFDLDYDDFYKEHCEILSQYVRAAEVQGISIFSLGESYIPALKRRKYSLPEIKAPIDDKKKTIISINPDLSDMDNGHFYSLDNTIRESLHDLNLNFMVLAGRDFDSDDNYIVPFFSYNSWALLRNLDIYTERFAQEFKVLSDYIKRLRENIVLYCYMGNLKLVRIIIEEVINKSNNCSLVINFFGADKYIDHIHEFINKNKNIIKSGKLTICVESKQLLIDQQLSDCVEQWPMIRSKTDSGSVRQNVLDANPGRTVVYFTSTPQQEKGFDVALDSIFNIEDPEKYLFRIRVTNHINSNTNFKNKLDLLKNNYADSVEVVEGALSADEYSSLYHTSDVIVVPYKAEYFRYKTSGALIDALYYCKAVIVSSNTWAADVVKKFDAGLVFEDENSSDLAIKISLARTQYKELQNKLKKTLSQLDSEFDPCKLSKFIVGKL